MKELVIQASSPEEYDVLIMVKQMREENIELRAKLDIAVKAMTEFNEGYKKDFHRNVCMQSMGCHCKPTLLDDALVQITERNE